MAHYLGRPEPFTCCICGKHQDTERMGWWQIPIPPLCRGCESGGHWSTGYGSRYRYAAESNPDRRILSQLRALFDQLHDEAIRVKA